MNLVLRKTSPGSRIVALGLYISFGFSTPALNAQIVKVFVSSKAGDRITP